LPWFSGVESSGGQLVWRPAGGDSGKDSSNNILIPNDCTRTVQCMCLKTLMHSLERGQGHPIAISNAFGRYLKVMRLQLKAHRTPQISCGCNGAFGAEAVVAMVQYLLQVTSSTPLRLVNSTGHDSERGIWSALSHPCAFSMGFNWCWTRRHDTIQNHLSTHLLGL
jgi:hypothetical protein